MSVVSISASMQTSSAGKQLYVLALFLCVRCISLQQSTKLAICSIVSKSGNFL